MVIIVSPMPVFVKLAALPPGQERQWRMIAGSMFRWHISNMAVGYRDKGNKAQIDSKRDLPEVSYYPYSYPHCLI